MKKTEKALKKAISLVLLLSISLSCSNTKKPFDLEEKLKTVCIDNDSLYNLRINTFTNFDWSELYVIDGPRFPDEIENIIGLKYDAFLNDNCRLYLFVESKFIVSECQVCDNKIGYSRIMNNNGFVRFPNKSIIKIRSSNIEGYNYIEIINSDSL